MAKEDSDNERSRSPRQSRLQRRNLAGMDLDPEGEDDEYKEADDEEFDESNIKHEDGDEGPDGDDDDDLDEEDDDDIASAPRIRRGRKRKATTAEPEDNDEDDDDEKAGDEGDDDDKEDKSMKAEEDETVVPEKKKGKKRGRKPKIPRVDDVMLDDKGNEIEVKDDQVVLENEDPKGCEKIDDNGFLQGERRFRIKTFTLLGKGERQYMVSTEPARLVGFRDSYLLFKTHLSLFKKVCTHDEKMDLINRHLIPTSYKGRSVNLVTARSIFREFGARMIVGGKKVIDDFWEEKARERGDVEGEYADPEEAISKGSGGDGNYPATGSALVNYQSDHTWMYQVSMQTLEFNKTLTEQRNQTWLRGVKDTYSGFNFYPTASQPQRATLVKVAEAEDEHAFDCSLRFYNPDVRKKVTGLASIPKEIFEDLDDEDVKKAILEQQAYEKSVAVLR